MGMRLYLKPYISPSKLAPTSSKTSHLNCHYCLPSNDTPTFNGHSHCRYVKTMNLVYLVLIAQVFFDFKLVNIEPYFLFRTFVTELPLAFITDWPSLRQILLSLPLAELRVWEWEGMVNNKYFSLLFLIPYALTNLLHFNSFCKLSSKTQMSL